MKQKSKKEKESDKQSEDNDSYRSSRLFIILVIIYVIALVIFGCTGGHSCGTHHTSDPTSDHLQKHKEAVIVKKIAVTTLKKPTSIK